MPALFCGPVPGPVPGVRASRWISGRLKAEACGKVGTMADSPAADGRTISHEATSHVDPHAIAEEEPRRSTGSCCPHGGGTRRSGHPSAGL